jgi:thiol-disulfide isomerase/thioredoxin
MKSKRPPAISSLFLVILLPTLVLIVIIYVLYSSLIPSSLLQSTVVSADSSNESIVNRKVTKIGKNFLYRAAENVAELDNERAIKYFREDKNPGVVVFYAPWCPHCIHYVNTYIKYSDSYHNKISFYAVNCVEYAEICNMVKVRGYPTVLAFHVDSPSDKVKTNKDIKWLELGRSEITNYLLTFQPTSSSLKPKQPMLDTPNNFSIAKVDNQNAFIEYYTSTQGGLAREAEAESRLNDGLKSLNYLLAVESKIQFDKKKQASMVSILSTLLPLLPNAHYGTYKRLLEWLTTSTIPVIIKDWDSKFTELVEVSDEFEVCGISKKNGENVHQLTGFTCGLWMLMHYCTVQSEVVGASAVDVLHMIYSIVHDLFGCLPCRNNFLRKYEACDYGRCQIVDTNDHKLLQLWLFHLHNSVTNHVYYDHLGEINDDTNVKHELIAKYKSDALLWPSVSSCKMCHTTQNYVSSPVGEMQPYVAYNPSIWTDKDVIQYLKQSYIL